jgi:hypothetical protein
MLYVLVKHIKTKNGKYWHFIKHDSVCCKARVLNNLQKMKKAP